MITASEKSKRTSNPIRNIVDFLQPPVNHPKKLVNLSLGDPTNHGNLFLPEVLKNTMIHALNHNEGNGYAPSVGYLHARKAIAQNNALPSFPISEDDVILASGCSGAIELVLTGLLNEGENILVPKPGFPLYQVISNSLGCSVKYYPCIVSYFLSFF